MSRVLAVTGTSTDVGKTVATAALAAAAVAAGLRVAVCKPVQTGVAAGDPGDLAEVTRLAGELTVAECARYRDPLAPDTAARREGATQVSRADIADTVTRLARTHDLTLVEGAGGVLVRLADDLTLLDVAADCADGIVVVSQPGLGALNHAELTVGAIVAAGVRPAGLIIGSWPQQPDLAMTCNRNDLPRLTGVPVVGVLPAGVGGSSHPDFAARAPGWFDRDWLNVEFPTPAPQSNNHQPVTPAVSFTTSEGVLS
ncbi:dethiobiotin synthase [Gordonia sp. ABSL1-1]|uniref:dethiobiotin synthase n=1 Tax=Gordonia sp. ABSL1-1 TaxID=3053923 RepID=UPI00257466F3|nr:dethiobiotin synthase [Gordonia sp. ABSL1-1]MDL9937448.1 dethiobiotin synthase [Gordonia sp. ABSL1-1]